MQHHWTSPSDSDDVIHFTALIALVAAGQSVTVRSASDAEQEARQTEHAIEVRNPRLNSGSALLLQPTNA